MGQATISVRNRGLSTGVAILNGEQHELEISLTLRDTEGQQLGETIGYLLEAGSRRALLLGQLFPEVFGEGFAGELVVGTEGGSFAAVALEFGDQPGQLTPLPVTRVEKD